MIVPPFIAEASAANPVTQITNEFGIRVPMLIAQIVNFVVVASLLWYFAFKPVLATIGERQRKIDAGLKYAEEMKAKLDAAQQAYDSQLREAQLKAREIVAEAQTAAKDLADRQQQEATHRANHLIETAQAAIELEKRKMLAEARAEIARLVVATAQQVLARQLTEPERGRYNEASAKELLQA
ncbi:MAG: F0F1 ATP synthase subunit B [Opitutaceae bacterium]